MNFLGENLTEVLKYFHITYTENLTNQQSNLHSNQRNLFSDFLKISSFLINLVTKNKLHEDVELFCK
jgi:hypothetical protein